MHVNTQDSREITVPMRFLKKGEEPKNITPTFQQARPLLHKLFLPFGRMLVCHRQFRRNINNTSKKNNIALLNIKTSQI